MPTPGSIARAHYRQQQLIVKRAALAAAEVWRAVEFADLDSSWAVVAGRAENLLIQNQYAAASRATAYVAAQARAQDVAAGDAVNAAAFAGRAADGRDLTPLLRWGIVNVKVAIGAGMSRPDAMLRGRATLSTIYANETAQAGRNADQVAITATPDMGGYVRVLSGASCSRCTILAGKFYRWNTGFQRHPHCDCIHLPAHEPASVSDQIISPRSYFDDLSTAEQDRTFGKAGAQAIRDGADMSQVVNARRGMASFDSGTTSEGTNVNRGRYGRAMGDATGQTDLRQRAINGRYGRPDMFETTDVARLTPRAIYDLAGTDRDLAVTLLRRYGYLS